MPLSKVRVLCPNGRRQVVQVDANTSILLIRETVCQKQNFDVQSHELKFHKRFLDDSSNLRFESIPNNAELELVKSTRQRSSGAQSKVIIMLQAEDGQRSLKEFLQTATLWDVVTEFGHENCAEGFQQSCRYLMKTVMGKEELQKTTLRSLGITDGRVCVRYMEVPILRNEGQAHVVSLDLSNKAKTETKVDSVPVKQEEKVKEDSGTAVEPQEYKENVVHKKEDKEEQSSREPSSAQTVSVCDENKDLPHVAEDVQMKDNVTEAVEEPMQSPPPAEEGTEDVQMKEEPLEQPASEPQDVELEEVKETEEEAIDLDVNIEFLDGNGSVLLDRSLSSSAYMKWDPPDDFFEFTLADAHLLQQRLREKVISESTLMLRGKSKPTASKKYSMCVIRIQLPPPEQLLLQSTFLPSDRIADVLSFVKGHMKDPSLDYYLFTAPPKTVLDRLSSLEANDLVPSCLLHLGVRSSDCPGILVKDEIRSKAVSVEAYNKKMGHKELKTEINGSKPKQKQSPDETMDYERIASTSSIRSNTNRSPQKSQNGVPKWFKLGKS